MVGPPDDATPSPDMDPTTDSRVALQPVAVLRRSNSQATPTRTLRLSEHETAAAAASPAVQDLPVYHRPRSNQRTRTPRRYESPMDPDAFRRTGTAAAASSSPVNNDGDNGTRTVLRTGGDRGTLMERTRPIAEVPLVSEKACCGGVFSVWLRKKGAYGCATLVCSLPLGYYWT